MTELLIELTPRAVSEAVTATGIKRTINRSPERLSGEGDPLYDDSIINGQLFAQGNRLYKLAGLRYDAATVKTYAVLIDVTDKF